MRSETAEAVTRSQRPSGGRDAPLLNGRLYGWRHRRGSRALGQPSVRGGQCVVWAEGGTSAFFWQFVNGTHGTPDRLKKMMPQVTPAFSMRSSLPFLLAASPAAFFIACGRPNPGRSSSTVLTVLLLLTGEHLEGGGGEKNERTGHLEWVGTPGVFFCGPRKSRECVMGNVMGNTFLHWEFVPWRSLRSL